MSASFTGPEICDLHPCQPASNFFLREEKKKKRKEEKKIKIKLN